MIDQSFIEFSKDIAGEFEMRSAEETFSLGKRIGEKINDGTIFLLSGDLGAGKTLFTKGLAAGLGIDPADVTSPSFTLVNVYEGRLPLYHVDLYRLESGACIDIGLEEIFEDDGAVTVIEWAERLDSVPGNAIAVDIQYLSDSDRKITIKRIS